MSYELTFLGLLLSLLYVSVTGFYPGGIIVPGYLVLFIGQPARIAGSLIVAILTLLCFKLASQYLIIFGRRKFVFMVLVGGIWTLIWQQMLPILFPFSLEFRVIGWVIPGLIANNFEKQGVIVTTASLVTVTVVTYLVGRLVAMVLP
jgi:poly-gamma-glutamate biosynthesis protein PgsC/CapC